jgi:hypothetical protein
MSRFTPMLRNDPVDKEGAASLLQQTTKGLASDAQYFLTFKSSFQDAAVKQMTRTTRTLPDADISNLLRYSG